MQTESATNDFASLSPAQRAWITIRARKAALAAGASADAINAIKTPASDAIKAKAAKVEPEINQAKPVRRERVKVDRVSPLADGPAEMTAGQKAAETRRLLEEARAKLKALKAGVQTPSDLADAFAVEMNIDDAKVGCGLRTFIVVEINVRAVTLFNVPTLTTITVDRISFEQDAKPYKTTKAKQLARIDAAIQTYEKSKLDYDVKAAKAAIRTLLAV
jgi:hypothetical protein